VLRILLYLFSIFLIFPDLVYADTVIPDSGESYFISDLGNYVTTPLRWDSEDWTKFGLIVGGIYIASETVDDYWKDEMVNEDHPLYYKTIDQIGDAWGDGRLSGAFMLGVYGYGHWTQNERYLNASHDMLQSVVYTTIMTHVLKQVFSRDRPNAATDESGWFNNGVSFPSGHTSVAFAVSRSFLNSLDHPSVGTKVLFYGLATSTALARTYDNAHWASDTIAGAILGIYTADYVSSQNQAHRNQHTFLPYINHNTIGFQMSW
jgi:hypothetical protein